MPKQQHYRRTVDDLRELASMFWPEELSKEAARLSVIPALLQTQDEFIAILSVPVTDLDNLFQIVNASSFSANLFLKHLAILADFGGEPLQRVNANFTSLFPSGKLDYWRNGELHSYAFQELPVSNLTNDKLSISGKKLFHERSLDELLQDVAAILIFGSACDNSSTAVVLAKCEIGDYLGQPKKLGEYVKQRYIWVSRITMGSQSNTLGQLAQQFVVEYLQNNLRMDSVTIQPNGRVPGITHTDERTDRPTSFDIVVSRNNKYVAIEISFQVTTNSTIERKAGQAQARYNQIQDAGYRIAYVLDGAGNLQRETALNTLCSHSHCTVTFSRSELELLCEFIRGYLK